MPMFEYQCAACGQRTERLSWGHGDAPMRCACGSDRLERIWYSRVAIGGGQGDAGGEGDAPCGAGGEDGCCGGACGMN